MGYLRRVIHPHPSDIEQYSRERNDFTAAFWRQEEDSTDRQGGEVVLGPMLQTTEVQNLEKAPNQGQWSDILSFILTDI